MKAKALYLSLVGLITISAFSFKKSTPSFCNSNWLIVEVDTAGSGYFRVDTSNRILLRLDKIWGGEGGFLYALDGNSKCSAIPKIKKREKGMCWLYTGCHQLEKIDSSRYTITLRTSDRDALFFKNFLKKLEYKHYLLYFLDESKGEVILRNDTLIYDMKVMRMGKELPFKIKCVRE